jgi:hypothetical protein
MYMGLDASGGFFVWVEKADKKLIGMEKKAIATVNPNPRSEAPIRQISTKLVAL